MLLLPVEEECHVQKKGKIVVLYILIFIFPNCIEYEEDYKILYQIVLRTSALKFLFNSCIHDSTSIKPNAPKPRTCRHNGTLEKKKPPPRKITPRKNEKK